MLFKIKGRVDDRGETLPMTLKTFIVVALLAAVGIVVLAVAVINRPAHHSAETGGTVLFPGLVDQADNIARLVVRSATGTLTIERGREGWYLKERDGYPVDVAKVRETVAEMAWAVLLEPKTARAERHILLDLVDPTVATAAASNHSGRELTLEDTNGKALVALIVGKRHFDLGSTDIAGGGEVYVRRPGETQTWLARTSLFPTTTPSSWVNPTVVGIDNTRVARVTFRHPDGQVVTVAQLNHNASPTIQPVPPPHIKVNESAARRVLTLLSAVTLEDVHKDDAVSLPIDKTIQIDVATNDGLRINVTVHDRDGATWLAVVADAMDRAEVRAEAAVLNSRTRGWLYQIPSYTAAVFHTRRDDLLEKPAHLEEGVP